MATLTYKGKPIEVSTGAELRDVVQLLLTDVGSFGNWQMAKEAQDKNRDSWLRDFFNWSSKKLTSNDGGVVPASLVSLLSLKTAPTAALPAATPTPTPTVIVKSPHRLPPLPTITKLHPDCDVEITGTDRAHQITIELTGAYPGSTGLCEVTFGTPYVGIPIIVGNQVGSDPRVDSWIVSYTNNGYRIDSASFGAGILKFNTIVCARDEEAFD